jgi:endonuclease YncB( thermonuclease family)
MKTVRLFALAVLLALAGLAATATELTGRVVGVSDGDTLTLRVADGASFRQVRIRLAERSGSAAARSDVRWNRLLGGQ